MQLSRYLITLALWCTSVHALPSTPLARDVALKFGYGSQKVRGVNLGGWFVLEPWITPSLFDALNGAAVDEYTLCQTLGKTEALNQLSNHWNTFITQGDFAAIAAAGLNHVRIPIGYWSVIPIDGEPYVQGAYEVLARALDWAQGVGLKVLIDLHGAPGSQNGYDNSGRRGSIGWGQGDTIAQTLKVIAKIRDDYANHPAVASIELVNEPLPPGVSLSTIQSYYDQAAGSLQGAPVGIVEHDAFQTPLSSWNSYGTWQQHAILDTHHYQCFAQNYLVMSPAQHAGAACDFGGQMRAVSKPTIAGEWCGATTDCARYLNGYGRGANYGNCQGLTSGSAGSLPQDQQASMRTFVEAQLDAFESAGGWIFWTWKTEQGAPGWDLGDLIATKIFPQPIDSRSFRC